jgi:hypothetical protein
VPTAWSKLSCRWPRYRLALRLTCFVQRSHAWIEAGVLSTGGDAASAAAGAATFFLRGMAFSLPVGVGCLVWCAAERVLRVCFGAPTRGGTFFRFELPEALQYVYGTLGKNQLVTTAGAATFFCAGCGPD